MSVSSYVFKESKGTARWVNYSNWSEERSLLSLTKQYPAHVKHMKPLLIFWGQWDNVRENIEDVSVSKSMRETFKYSDSTYNFSHGDKFDFLKVF